MYLSHFYKYCQIDLQKIVPKHPSMHKNFPVPSNIEQSQVLSFFCIFANLEKNYICCHLNFNFFLKNEVEHLLAIYTFSCVNCLLMPLSIFLLIFSLLSSLITLYTKDINSFFDKF